MRIETEDLLNSILKSLDRIDYIKTEDIPNIDLYMDQVTTFMERKLKNSARNGETDKILTKTMINNYAKNDLLPPPEKKKYSKDHILMLIFIYYYKGVLSINDIQELLGPITKNFFHKKGKRSLEDIYNEIFAIEKEEVEVLKKDVADKFAKSEQLFLDADEEEKQFLQMFSFIGFLSFDVYIKKLMIEKMIDGFRSAKEKGHGTKEKTEKEKRKSR